MSMRGTFPPAALLFLFAGCQHFAREPLDISRHYESLRNRELGVEPIAAYASALNVLQVDPSGPFDPSDGLNLREAQAVALWYNPELQVARMEAALALSRAETAGIWPDPALDLGVGRKREEAEGGFLQGAGAITRSSVASGGLGLTIPLSGRIFTEKALRGAEHEASLLAVAHRENSLLAAFTTEWFELSALDQAARLHEGHLAALGAFADVTQRLAEVGEMDPTNARLFLLEHARIHAKLQELQHAEKRQRLRLFSLLGLAPDAPAVLLPELAAPELPATDLDDAAVLATHPRMDQLRMEYEASEQRLRLEVKRQYPDITIGPGFAKEKDELTQLLNLSVPLPLWNMNRAAIAEAGAGRDLARARVYAEYEALLGDLAQLREGLVGSIAQRKHLEEVVAPLADRQMEEAQALLEIGEIDAALLFNLLSQVFQVKLDLLQAVVAQEKLESQIYFMICPPAISSLDLANELRNKP